MNPSLARFPRASTMALKRPSTISLKQASTIAEMRSLGRTETVMLEALRPEGGAELGELHSVFEEQGWRGALPASLTERQLLGLARDLRVLESNTRAHEETPDLASPMFAVLYLMMEHPERSSKTELQVSDSAIDSALHAYQWAIEREIVTRIIGVSAGTDTNGLLSFLGKLASA